MYGHPEINIYFFSIFANFKKINMLFKINIYLRFVLIAIGLILGILLWVVYGFGYGFLFLIAAIVLLAGYFLLGTVQSSSEYIQNMEFDKAERQLRMTFFPNLLYVTNRSIYYILKGTIAAQKKDNKDAEALFQKALSLDLPSDNERAMVLLQLANIQASKNNWSGAKAHFQKLKALKISEPLIKNKIDEFELAIKQSGQINVARSMGKPGMQMMMGMGGKRRRPTGR
jgi:tetratricopeptide (TPR) repeat protein